MKFRDDKIFNPEDLYKEIPVVFDVLCLMVIHGCICLALRHPQFTGPSRKVALDFIEKVERALLKANILDQEDIEYIHQVEREEILKMKEGMKHATSNQRRDPNT